MQKRGKMLKYILKKVFNFFLFVDKTVYFSGSIGSGKTTILNVLEHKVGETIPVKDYENTPNNIEDYLISKIEKTKYSFTDTNGEDYYKGERENYKDKLGKKYKDKIENKVVEFYVFNAKDFYNKKLMIKIMGWKEEMKNRKHKHAIIGTHKDEIAKQVDDIEKEIKEKAETKCKIFQLTDNPNAKSELEKFIDGVANG